MTAESMDDTRMDIGAIARAIASRWFRIVVVTVVLLGATYAILAFVPKMYESSSSVLVETRDNAFMGPATGTSSSSGGAAVTIDSVISSQIGLIKSRDTLLEVVDTLNLRSVPEFNGAGVSPIGLILQLIGRKPEVKGLDETVLTNLNERLTVIRERDSAIISIFVSSIDPERAAAIADAIAAAHVKRRANLSLQDTAEASQWLEAEIVKLRERVSAAEQEVADFRIEHDLLAGANNTSLVDQQLSTIATQISQATERLNTARSRATLIRGLIEQGQPIDGLADVQNSVVIQQLSQSKAELQRQLAEKSSTLLPNHPTIRALRAQLGEIEDQIRSEGRRVATALEAEARVEEDLVASLQDEMARLKMNASSQTLNTVTLDELEREAKAQRDILESYLLRYRDAVSRSESSSALPDVRVVTAAAPSTTPASPKTALILAAVAFSALALQIGGIIFGELISGRALAAPPARSAETEVDNEPVPVVAAAADDEPELPFVAPSVAPDREPSAKPPRLAVSDYDLEPIYEDDIPDLPPRRTHSPVNEAIRETGEAEPVSAVRSAETSPVPAAQDTQPRAYVPDEPDIAALSSDLALGRVRVVMVASIGPARDARPIVEALIADALRNGLTVAHVDAATGRATVEPGLTDLASGKASFGDIVKKDLRASRADVGWGTIATLDRRSNRPATLIEALSDIYDVVIVSAGRIGMTSPLPLFAGVDCRLLLVAGPHLHPELVAAALADAEALGFGAPELVAAPLPAAEVA